MVRYGSTTLIAATAALGLLLAGCASSSSEGPSFGSKVRSEGNELVDLGKSWEDGKRQVSKGESMVKQGEKQIRKGDRAVREGERLIETGAAQASAHEAAYTDLSSRTGAASSPAEARKEAAAIQSAADKWHRGEEKLAEGRALVQSGEKQRAEGRSKIREGQQMIAQGRDQMRQSEALYQGPDAAAR